MAQTFTDRYTQILSKLIDEAIADERVSATGSPVNDIAIINWRIGMISGLKKALILMDEAESVLLGKERDQ